MTAIVAEVEAAGLLTSGVDAEGRETLALTPTGPRSRTRWRWAASNTRAENEARPSRDRPLMRLLTLVACGYGAYVTPKPNRAQRASVSKVWFPRHGRISLNRMTSGSLFWSTTVSWYW